MKWIKVEDQKPQNSQYVLVNIKRKTGGRVFCACYSEFHNFYVIGKGNHERNVTHWMPFPQPVGGE